MCKKPGEIPISDDYIDVHLKNCIYAVEMTLYHVFHRATIFEEFVLIQMVLHLYYFLNHVRY